MIIGYYSLPCIRGRQGDHYYYLIQCPARLLPRIFLFNEVELPIAIRRGRSTEPSHVAEMVMYLSSNLHTYTITPLLAVVDREVAFEALSNEMSEIGKLQIPITARLIINDGQHRRAAIQQLIAKDTSIGNDTIPVMLIPDPELERSARLHADLNRYQLRPTVSKRILYDRGDLAILVRQLVDEIPLFQGRTELEKTTISNRSTALFTISAVYQATAALLGIGKKDDVDLDQIEIAQQFWQEIGDVIPEWRKVIDQNVTSAHLRQNYVHSHTVTLIAIGMAGHDLIATYRADWHSRLHKLEEFDWSKRNAAVWEGRAMVRGKMSKSHDSVKLTAIMIKRFLGVALTEKEISFERARMTS